MKDLGGIVLEIFFDRLTEAVKQTRPEVAAEDSVVEAVRQDLLERSQRGIQKYGKTLDRTDLNLKDWLAHSYEELLDAALYTKRAIRELEQAE